MASTQDMALIFPDRIIAVRGTIENMSKAEVAISTLLRECMEKDIQSAVQLTFCACHNTGFLIFSWWNLLYSPPV